MGLHLLGGRLANDCGASKLCVLAIPWYVLEPILFYQLHHELGFFGRNHLPAFGGISPRSDWELFRRELGLDWSAGCDVRQDGTRKRVLATFCCLLVACAAAPLVGAGNVWSCRRGRSFGRLAYGTFFWRTLLGLAVQCFVFQLIRFRGC